MAQTPDEPLTLTVHSLPTPDQTGASAAASTRSGRWKMLGLLLVCAAPVIASYFTYYVIRPEGRRNYGELIDPQRPLPAFTGVNAQGQTVPLTSPFKSMSPRADHFTAKGIQSPCVTGYVIVVAVAFKQTAQPLSDYRDGLMSALV